MSKIGYNLLSDSEKIVYNQFEKAFNNYESVFEIRCSDKKIDEMKIQQAILGDNPQIIYFNKSQIRVSTSLFGGKQVHLYGAAPSAKARRMQKRLYDELETAVEKIELLNPMSDYDKLICIYEYLQDNVVYDSKELESLIRLGKVSNQMSHNAYGALVNRLSVCDGIASAFSLIAQKMGFDCLVINGKMIAQANTFSDHSWNVIKVSDNFYHIDATLDLSNKEERGEYSYDYFCIDDDSISKDHDWDINFSPVCSHEDRSYYIRNRCFANNLSQLEEIFLRFSKSKQQIVRAKIADGIAIPEPEDKYLSQNLLEMASSIGKYGTINYFWNEKTRCFYAKFMS